MKLENVHDNKASDVNYNAGLEYSKISHAEHRET